jgi:hypothetical protein
MSNLISWPAQPSPIIASYLVQSSSVFAGPYATIATIPNTPSDPSVYSTVTNSFYYNDGAGTLTTWYRLVIVDTLANQTVGPAFQVGSQPPERISRPYTADAILSSAKLRALIPVASGRTFSDDDLLSFATDEMRNTLVPAILSVRQKYYEARTDFAMAFDPQDPTGRTLGPYQIPYRAIGADPSLVQLLDSSGRPTEVPRVDTADMPFQNFGLWILGDQLYVNVSPGTAWSGLRVYFALRTNRLVLSEDVAVIQSVNFTTNTVTLANVPDSFPVVGNFDLVRSNPNFGMQAYDQPGALSGAVVSFDPVAYPLPATLVAGDQLSVADTSAVVQLPVEWHPILAQAVACRMLEALGDQEGLQAANAKLGAMMSRGMGLVKNRIGSNPRTVYNVHSPLRRWM